VKLHEWSRWQSLRKRFEAVASLQWCAVGNLEDITALENLMQTSLLSLAIAPEMESCSPTCTDFGLLGYCKGYWKGYGKDWKWWSASAPLGGVPWLCQLQIDVL